MVFACIQIAAAQGQTATLVIEVRAAGRPLAGADVIVAGRTYSTDANGTVSIGVAAGAATITIVKEGFTPVTSSVRVAAGQRQPVLVDLERQPALEEEVFVSATRTNKRVEDQPLRVEVVPGEEVQEKIMMTPGDVSMLLNETNGLRVQTTSPSIGGASVRIQGLRGRYAQILADGLPLYGGQTGSIGLLQIPPMDLGQVEVIKGVASALYGMSAIAGVVNLVSRRPPSKGREAEFLINGTSHGGADVVNWLAAPLGKGWGYTFVGGLHFQRRSDLDDDDWTDLPSYRRAVARPRLFWDNGRGKSILVAFGAMGEERRGGTLPGRDAPDGQPFAESLDTRRVDGGIVARAATSHGVLWTMRGSATSQHHTQTFGAAIERDIHRTLFGEASATGVAGAHTWVVGAALQRDAYQSLSVPRFDYTYTVPGLFAQDEVKPTRWLTLSGSVRVDHHSEFGTFVSPRLSALVRPSSPWTWRISGGRGYFAPTPFTDETEATGLSRVAALGRLKAEQADGISSDLTWTNSAFEITATLFSSRVHYALAVRDTGNPSLPLAIVNAGEPTRTRGTELIARYHVEDTDIILTHMFLWSTEADPNEPGRREVPLNPRHSATFDLLREIGPARVGFEVFYTGRQSLDDNPYRDRGFPYVLFGGLVDWRIGSGRVFVNIENVGDIRQTREHRLIRPAPDAAGRWTVDAWAPLDGRTVNAGIRIEF
jgi:iron complex outermembrane receptor protein